MYPNIRLLKKIAARIDPKFKFESFLNRQCIKNNNCDQVYSAVKSEMRCGWEDEGERTEDPVEDGDCKYIYVLHTVASHPPG
jgi:hypothetical protein